MSPSHHPGTGAGSGTGCCPPVRGDAGPPAESLVGWKNPGHTQNTCKAAVPLPPLPEKNKRRKDRGRKRGQNPTLTSPAGLSAKRLRQGPAPDRCPARREPREAGEEASVVPLGPYGCPRCHQGRGWMERGRLYTQLPVASRTPGNPKLKRREYGWVQRGSHRAARAWPEAVVSPEPAPWPREGREEAGIPGKQGGWMHETSPH